MTAPAVSARGADVSPGVVIRRVRRADARALEAFIARLSPAARRRRFLGAVTAAGAARGLVERSVGLVACNRDDGRVIGHACFVPRRGGRAELGVAVLDAWQGRGIGELLLRRLAALAAARGVRTFAARLSPRNAGLVDALVAAGVPVDVRRDGDLMRIVLPVTLDVRPSPGAGSGTTTDAHTRVAADDTA